MSDLIFGYTWEQIQRAQRGGHLADNVRVAASADYGADPIGDGKFRMVPSGDIVDFDERCRRLGRKP